MQLIQRCTIWCPTWLGAFCIGLLMAIPIVSWFNFGESFLSQMEREPGEILVVEGWIGPDGIRAAAAEFKRGGYERIVVTGGYSKPTGWEKGGWSYAEGAQHELVRAGISDQLITIAQSRDTKRQRTYESAVAVWHALRALVPHPTALNVFTTGPHARRSRLVFAKVEGPKIKVGVVSWKDPADGAVPWWQSSDRAKELITETAGYLYEAFFNSGRLSNAPAENLSIGITQAVPAGN